ncbi:DMT family transporter [Diaminobutyricimonas sp. TR449]|uniref:DMT family transporter n=1 Tax=Diaminobutyricimonas sp. TR449 TaxID=2708076 RepID=UPI001421A829|nr:DMT family transporter [Diaminobutyricimonas sp. TR449]
MKSILFLVLATLFWAGNFVAGAGAVASVSPLHLTWLRWAIAVLPLLALAQVIEKPNWKRSLAQWPLLVLLSALGMAGFPWLLYTALEYTSALNASLINAVNPALIVIIAVVVFRQRIRWNGIVGIIIGLVGVVVVITDGRIGDVFTQPPNQGDALMVAAIVVWSAYTFLGRFLTGVPPITATALQALFTTVGLAPFAISSGVALPTDTPTMLALLYIALFASVLAYVFWNAALRTVPPAKAGIYLNLMVVFTALITLAIGGTIPAAQILGGILVVGGVVLTSARPRKRTVRRARRGVPGSRRRVRRSRIRSRS